MLDTRINELKFNNNVCQKLKYKNETQREIRMVLTQECNYDCGFCHKEGLHGTEKPLLNSDDYRFIYNVWKKYFGLNSTTLSWWEPLKRDDIVEITKKIKEEWWYITLVSNGWLLLEKSDIGKYVDRINVSIHSLDEIKYKELIRKDYSIQTVIDGIKKVKDLYPEVEIRLNSAFVKWLNAEESDIMEYIKFAKNIWASVKYMELYPKQSEWFIDIKNLEDFLEKNEFSKIGKWRQREFDDGQIKIFSTKIFCSEASEKINSWKFCNKNNDLFLTPDGNIKICRNSDNYINAFEIIKTNDEEWFADKLYNAFSMLGSNCKCK